jgi:hypothetical protein
MDYEKLDKDFAFTLYDVANFIEDAGAFPNPMLLTW